MPRKPKSKMEKLEKKYLRKDESLTIRINAEAQRYYKNQAAKLGIPYAVYVRYSLQFFCDRTATMEKSDLGIFFDGLDLAIQKKYRASVKAYMEIHNMADPQREKDGK